MVDVPKLDAYHFYEQDWDNYDQLFEAFEWEIPEQFNMASYVCDRWANDRSRVAIFGEDEEGTTSVFTYWQLQNITNQLANYLVSQGVEPGDRIAVNSPQKPETMMAHIAIWKVGAVSVPMSTLFGADGLGFRLTDSGAVGCIVDSSNIDAFREARESLSSLQTVLVVGEGVAEGDEEEFWSTIESYPAAFDVSQTSPENNAIILYTSGTTGKPKGVVRGHGDLLAFLPMLVLALCNTAVTESDVFWSPAEWAWIGTLYCNVLPPMYFGKAILSYESGKFNPRHAYEIIERWGVTNYYAPPTVLRMMMEVDDSDSFEVDTVHTIATGGEEVSQSLIDWANETFGGAAVNQIYGQTEANPLTLDCEALLERRPGTIGKPMPGVTLRLVKPGSTETITEPDTVGEMAVDCTSSPVCFKEYWKRPKQTAEKKRADGLLLTEDLGSRDADGYFSFHSRKDDVIISSGYRIGPAEIEDCLVTHDTVAHAGVIGVPDDERGEVPKAFVQLTAGVESNDELRTVLQTFVKDRLAKYEYPREITFVDELPTTETGKIRRSALHDWEDAN